MTETTKQPVYASKAKPWLKYYEEKYIHQTVPECSAFELVCRNNERHLGDTALEYYGRKFSYADLIVQVKKTAAALPKFQAIPGVAVVQGSPDNIEVTAAGVDKGSALLALADLLGIPHENTLAVGDSENDRAMLEKAGIAAVMANGMPQIKAIGSIVSEADCDHDGVAELFGRLGI